MPTIPQTRTLTKGAVDILNAIRNNASDNYKGYVPESDGSLDSLREIGNIIMNYPTLQNEFLSALVNRIGLTLITSKMFNNPWSVFKRGTLEFGETIEEIFVNIIKAHEYDTETAESKVFKREIPDVRAAFHVLNYKKFYKQTIQSEQLRQAFLSWRGITDLITKIVEAMYSSAAYDEFMTMKYLLALNILNGRLTTTDVAEVTAANAKSIVSTIKAVSNKLTFMTDKYNIAGVQTYTNKTDQYLIVNSLFDSIMDVEVLASAFNMDKAEFMGRRILVDGFGDLDIDRLDALFGAEESYHHFTSAELEALNAVPAVLIDREWFMIFDNIYRFTEQYNGEGLYWNYWYHVWKTFSISPFANATVLVPQTSGSSSVGVTSVSVSPQTASIVGGASIPFTVTVVTTGFAPKTVDWSMTFNNGTGELGEWTPEQKSIFTLSDFGVLQADFEKAGTYGYPTGGTITITATSTFDNTVTRSATITPAISS